MDFRMPQPDPERVAQCLDNLKTAFNKAAEADTGRAQPLFEKLRDSFVTALDQIESRKLKGATRPLSPADLVPAMGGMQNTIHQIAQEAAVNPKAAAVIKELDATVKGEVQSLITGVPVNQNTPQKSEPTHKRVAQGKGKMPNKGKYDL